MDYSNVRGFNYQPSYSSCNYDAWKNFDAKTIELELRRGKQYFPKMNTVRIWLSFDAYHFNEEAFLKNFEEYLRIIDMLGMKALPCLLNRCHSDNQDLGGEYIETIYGTRTPSRANMHEEYVKRIIEEHKNDERILIWDLCNEPFFYNLDEFGMTMLPIELKWLKGLFAAAKSAKPIQPVSMSMHQSHGAKFFDNIDEMCEVYLIHPYFGNGRFAEREPYINDIKTYMEKAASKGKECLVTETVWGATDDDKHVDLMRTTFEVLNELNLGYIVHVLHNSENVDMHQANEGPIGTPEYMAFINKDGSLRKGHDLFNKYCK